MGNSRHSVTPENFLFRKTKYTGTDFNKVCLNMQLTQTSISYPPPNFKDHHRRRGEKI